MRIYSKIGIKEVRDMGVDGLVLSYEVYHNGRFVVSKRSHAEAYAVARMLEVSH